MGTVKSTRKDVFTFFITNIGLGVASFAFCFVIAFISKQFNIDLIIAILIMITCITLANEFIFEKISYNKNIYNAYKWRRITIGSTFIICIIMYKLMCYYGN